MARPLTSPLHVARHMLASDKSLLFFVEVSLAIGTMRLVKNSQHLFANGHYWQAGSIGINLPVEDGSGSMGQITFTVPNASQLPMSWVELDDPSTGKPFLLGRPITCWLQHEGNLTTFAPGLSWKHRILNAEITEKFAVFECGHPADLIRVPSQVYDRVRFPQLRSTGGFTQ